MPQFRVVDSTHAKVPFTPTTCKVDGCSNPATQLAGVKVVSGSRARINKPTVDLKVYDLPLCDEHAKSSKVMSAPEEHGELGIGRFD
ncbi:MAG: hypothetical protein QM723_02775 [Myxococcaceae bacterium]